MFTFEKSCAYCHCDHSYTLWCCSCGTTICPTHLRVHQFKKHPLLYSVLPDGTVIPETLSSDQLDSVQKSVLSVLNSDDTLIRIDCVHPIIKNKDMSIPEKCDCCDITTNLWICAVCGQSGCSREQEGPIKGSSHAYKHFISSRHNVAVFSDSISTLGDGDAFCYDCDSFIRIDLRGVFHTNRAKRKSFSEIYYQESDKVGIDRHLEDAKSRIPQNDSGIEINQSENFTANQSEINISDSSLDGSLLTKESSKEVNLEDGTPVRIRQTITRRDKQEILRTREILKQYSGLRNFGNTCFLSSVMQLLAGAVNEDESHFLVCAIPPLLCLRCQFTRVTNALGRGARVDPRGLIETIYSTFGVFDRGLQHDAGELLMLIIPHIDTKLFRFEINQLIHCECGSLRRRVENDLLLLVPFRNKVSESVNTYFSSSHCNCDCNGTASMRSYFRILPHHLMILVNRIDDFGMKITDPIITDNLVIQDYLHTVVNIDKAKRIEESGFTEDQAKNALILTDNNEEEAIRRLLAGEGVIREKKKYSLKAAICHRGESINTGHYTCVIKKENRYIIIDDEKVTEGSEEDVKKAYVLLYE